MRSQKVIKQKSDEIGKQIRETAETATKQEWDKFHVIGEPSPLSMG